MACPALDAKLPDFTADSQVGMIGAHDFLAHSWSVVFSVNGDFDAVATTVSEARRTCCTCCTGLPRLPCARCRQSRSRSVASRAAH